MGRPLKHYTDAELAALRDRRNELRREEYRRDGGKRKAENQAWKDAHREQVRKASREYVKRRRQLDPDYNEKQKEWRANNKDKVSKYNRRSREGKFGKEYNTAWQAKNRIKNPLLYMWRNCKNRAKRLGVEFSIKQSDIFVPDFCPVLGFRLEFGHGKGTGFFSPNSPSVDRFDNSKGYTKENIRIISWRANMLKHDATVDELRAVVAYMERIDAQV